MEIMFRGCSICVLKRTGSLTGRTYLPIAVSFEPNLRIMIWEGKRPSGCHDSRMCPAFARDLARGQEMKYIGCDLVRESIR